MDDYVLTQEAVSTLFTMNESTITLAFVDVLMTCIKCGIKMYLYSKPIYGFIFKL